MPPWKGSISELLTEEQLKTIEATLADAPAGICVDKRGLPLNRYPGLLSDLDHDREPLKIVASERPVTERGLILVSAVPVPDIANALLVIRTDENFQQRIHGHAHASRTGSRAEDRNQKTPFHFSVFEPMETGQR